MNIWENHTQHQEWAATFTKDPDGQLRKLIPIRIADVKPIGLLAPLVYIDLFNCKDEKSAINLLVEGINPVRDKPSITPRFPKQIDNTNVPPPFPAIDRKIKKKRGQSCIIALLTMSR